VNFREAESYLLSLGNEVETMKLGLDNIRKLVEALGNPQKNYLKVQVAGTNGKGSVCAFLDSICLEADVRTGVFTSPHLMSITERIRIDGMDISEGEFARLATKVREVSEKLVSNGDLENVPTFFEQVTAMALLAFAEANVEVAILETGLGGRFDAVTAASSEIAVITRIDVDHQEHLGSTIQEIAAEKAAIIRPDSKLALGEQQQDALNVILNRSRQASVEPRRSNEIAPLVLLGLKGRHQVENAKVAILVAEILNEHFPITAENIAHGLKKARHPGRLESVGRFLFDGAHNAGGAKVLREYLDEFIDRPVTMVFGAMKGKDVSEMAKILWPKAEQVILTRPENPRAMSAGELASFAPETIDADKIVLANSAREAIETAQDLSSKNSIILVAGSLYLVGEVKKLLNNLNATGCSPVDYAG
jgi:dihydrofolate synthase / folylpolyglutamate synthase